MLASYHQNARVMGSAERLPGTSAVGSWIKQSGPRESTSTEEPILVQEAQDETQREMEVKEDRETPSLLSRARFACQERIHIAVTFRTYGPLRAAHRGSGFCEDKPPW